MTRAYYATFLIATVAIAAAWSLERKRRNAEGSTLEQRTPLTKSLLSCDETAGTQLHHKAGDTALSPVPMRQSLLTVPPLKLVEFKVNGAPRRVSAEVASTTMLATYLRENELLTGTKLSCREGGCGACTVLLRRAPVPTTATAVRRTPEELATWREAQFGRTKAMKKQGDAASRSRRTSDDEAGELIPVNACMRRLAACDGCEIVTVEGVGSEGAPHTVQEALVEADASQCGFCTPGMVNAMVALLERTRGEPTERDVEDAFDGNLCRCTGYRRIFDAALSLISTLDVSPAEAVRTATRLPHSKHARQNGKTCNEQLVEIEDLCARKHQTKEHSHVLCFVDAPLHLHSQDAQVQQRSSEADVHTRPIADVYSGTCSNGQTAAQQSARTRLLVVTPATRRASPPVPLVAASDASSTVAWYKPSSVVEALEVKRAVPEAVFAGANTGIAGVAKYYNGEAYGATLPPNPPAMIDLSSIDEMQTIVVSGDSTTASISIGAATPLAVLLRTADELGATASLKDGHRWRAVAAHLKRVANHQVRSVGTIGGNLMLASKFGSFASDVNLLCSLLGATATVADPSKSGRKTVEMPNLHTLNWDKLLLVGINLPAPELKAGQRELVFTFKVALRRQNAHALLNAGFAFIVDAKNTIVKATIAYGGVAGDGADGGAKLGGNSGGGGGTASIVVKKSVASASFHGGVLRATAAEAALRGSTLGDEAAFRTALHELTPVIAALDSSLGRTQLRKFLISSLFYKAMLMAVSATSAVPKSLAAAAAAFERPLSSGAWDIAGASHAPQFPVSKPMHKLSALAQCTGAARYTDDLPRKSATLHAALALAREIGVIGTIDTTAAKQAEGVVDVFTASDLSAAGLKLSLGEGVEEESLVSHEIPYVGARVALVIATTRALAEAAARLVQVSLSEVRTPILTIDDAIAAKSFFNDAPAALRKGDAASALKSSDVIVRGSVSVGHQYHFYMETQSAYATIDGTGGVAVDVATQSPGSVASAVAHALGVSASKVEARMERAGGGYGGKATRSVPTAVLAACAAALTQAPVSLVLPLNENMDSLGSRRPHKFEYVIGATKDGVLTAVTGATYALQGWTSDMGLLAMAMDLNGAIDGPFNVPNWDVTGRCCRTTTPSNTFCRGPIHLPGHLLIEAAVEAVAAAVELPPALVRARNLYRAGDVTPTGQLIDSDNMARCVDEAKARCGFDALVAAVDTANATNKYVKEGIALSAFKYSMGKAHGYKAIVSVRADGSVLVQQSGCEIGQGLNVKQAQVAAQTLKCPIGQVHVDLVSSKLSMQATGGSTTSEGNAASVRLACEDLVRKLQPITRHLTESLGRQPAWAEVVEAAVDAKADMTGYGCYSGQFEKGVLPGDSKLGPSQYLAFGACVSHVRYDALLAEATVLRAEIVTDQGYSLNPSIDAGQVQGAFTMGLGYVLTEEFLFSEKGANASNGTWEYKPPSSQDIPVVFNISFLKDVPNAAGIYSSKAVGEPAMLASASILAALRHAVGALRKDGNVQGAFDLSVPATPEAICVAAAVNPATFSFAE